jgi:hypothetical protein
MDTFSKELLRRFPEITTLIEPEDVDLPYQLTTALLEWLTSVVPSGIEIHVIDRVVDFQKWCETQPTSPTAESDAYTIFVVGVLEELFKRNELRSMIPYLISEENIRNNETYLRKCVGESAIKNVLEQFQSRSASRGASGFQNP